MPKFLPIPDFARAGLNSDSLPWDLPGSNLTDLRNIRIKNGQLNPFGGSKKVSDLPVDFEPGYLQPVASTAGFFWLVAGKGAVYSWDAASFVDVSNSLTYPGSMDGKLWTGCMLSNIPILSNPGWFPEYWAPQSPSVKMQLLPWDAGNTWQDANETCKIVRSHKRFLFALDLLSQGVEIPDGVRWSAPADVNGLPPTWDHLDTTQFAGLVSLGGEGGTIVDGYSLRDAFCVYRRSGVSVFDYVGGPFVWQIRHLSQTMGLIAKDCIVEVNGSHLAIGDGDVFINDGNSLKSIMHNRIRTKFISDIDSDNFRNSYAIKNSAENEAWFCVPEAGAVHPTIAYIYNWRDDTWSIRDIPGPVSSKFGVRTSPALTWDNIGGTWATVSGAWDQRAPTPLDETVMGVTFPEGPGQSGGLYVLDVSLGAIDGPFDCKIERIGFALEGLNKVTTITRVYPHVSGPGDLFIQVGSQDFPGAPIRWKEPVSFNAERDRKIDIRTTGELHCFRIYSDDIQSTWNISGIDVEYVEAGYR